MKWMFLVISIAGQAAYADTPNQKQTVVVAPAKAKAPAEPNKLPEAPATPKLTEASTNYFNNSQVAPKQEVSWIGKLQDPVGIFTGLLALVAAYQAYITRTSLRDSKLAAEAANRSAQLAVSIQVPRLVLFKLSIEEVGVGNLAAKLQSPKARVVLKNYGKTPAFLESQALGIYLGLSLPQEPNYSPFAYDLEPENIVEPDAQYTLNGIRPFHQPEQISAIIEQRTFLWVYGYVQYKDFLGSRHITRFCKQLLFSTLKNDHYQFSEGAVPTAYLESA
jgi:hypothetical protein